MIKTWFYGIAATLAVLAIARILFLLAFRRPVLGRTLASELSEMERAFDRDMYLAHVADSLPSAADIPFKPVLTRVEYEVAGATYRADLSLLTYKGSRPDSRPTLWYDPADPRRVTGIGPAWAAALILLGGGIAVFGHELPF
jgi:hypothetical protein